MYLVWLMLDLIDNDKANILGLDESDPNAQDDVITTELTFTSWPSSVI